MLFNMSSRQVILLKIFEVRAYSVAEAALDRGPRGLVG